MSEDTKKVFRKKDGIVSRRIAGETILVPVMGKLADMQRIFSLNAIGEYIWDRIDGKRDLQEIGEAVASVFDVSRDRAGGDVAEFMAELEKEELILGVD